jgi:hypothetical protein
MPRRSVAERSGWRVTIERHTLHAGQQSWRIPASTTTRFEGNRATAVRMAVLEAHVAAGVLPFRSLERESIRHAAAERTAAIASGGADRA